MRLLFYSFFLLLIFVVKSNSITPLKEVSIYCVWADPNNTNEAFYQPITEKHFYMLDDRAKDCSDREEDLYLLKKSENKKLYKKLRNKYFKEDCCEFSQIARIDSNFFNLIKEQVPKYKKERIENKVNNLQSKENNSEDDLILEKFDNLIKYKIQKRKVITLSQIKELYFPKMTQPFSKEEDLNKWLYKYFVEYSEKSELENPWYIFTGLNDYERLYQLKLYKSQKKIKKIIEKSKKSKKTSFKDRNLISLLDMRDNLLSIRKNLGIPKNKTTEEVLEYYSIMYEFLDLDVIEVIPTQRTEQQKREKFYIERYIKILNKIKETLNDAKINS
ncbi:hypothetical protein N8700_04330 [Candidatus Pelagibacter sp.]|nr:hypothetical protein [Candidatus Pelagibacter sp.]